MARHNRRQEQGSAWGALLGVPLMLGFDYTITGDAVPLVGRLTMCASERSVTFSGCREVRGIGKAPLYAGTTR